METEGLVAGRISEWPERACYLVVNYELEDGGGLYQYRFEDESRDEVRSNSPGLPKWMREVYGWLDRFVNRDTINHINMATLVIARSGDYVLELKFQKGLESLRMEEHRLRFGDEAFEEDYSDYLKTLPNGYQKPELVPVRLVKKIEGTVEFLSDANSSENLKKPDESLHERSAMVQRNAAQWRADTAHVSEAEALGTIRSFVMDDLPDGAERWAVKGRVNLPDPAKGETKVHLSGEWWFKRLGETQWTGFAPSSPLSVLHAIRRLRDIYADEGEVAQEILVFGRVDQMKVSVDLNPSELPD